MKNAQWGVRKRRKGIHFALATPTLCFTAVLSRSICSAYIPSPVTRIPTATKMFEFSSTGRNLLEHQVPQHGRSVTEQLKNVVGMTAKGSNEEFKPDDLVDDTSQEKLSRYDDWLFGDREKRVAFYGILAFLETIFWYWLAPGIDPESPWFNPADGKLIANLLNPSNIFSPEIGSGLGFSSLLLNSFLILPVVWSLLLLQEGNGNDFAGNMLNDTMKRNISTNVSTAIRNCVCASGFLVGGGILVPYMMFRRPLPFRRHIDPDQFPVPLRLFEEQSHRSISNLIALLEPIGLSFLLILVSVVVFSFLLPFASHQCDWNVEWSAFVDRAHSSQFTALALYDFSMISIVVLDPMMDDAMRRGYVRGWEATMEGNCDRWKREERSTAILTLSPFVLFPLIGPVAWICLRPRYHLDSAERQ